ncbi:Na+/H+ antiporter subunit E [Chromohalobacter japonicus]|uniref:Na+/H+ antiporter subunit E n=1 Tax=Chromohalobacter japonicus TaxID=223900 RepID=A0A1Q8T9N0_9GAMM|nr:Na+/H+ antiporter subunit E [Chromohalobacter japonicus]OLO10318.1 Na+/H+ antiporter subunit E [Chromohalobacter japonicus]
MIRPRKWLPMPLLSVLLLIVWLLLMNGVALGHWLLGGFLAIVIPLITKPFWEAQPRIKKPWLMVRYFFRVLLDIVVANLEASKVILDPLGRARPAFVEYPLTLQENFAITMLASTITLTPGTVSAHLRMDGKTLLIHVLDVDDIGDMKRHIHERYERPLKEIFEC